MRRRRDRVIAAVAGGLVVALIAAGIATNALGSDDEVPPENRPSQEERSLRALVPDAFRTTCSRSATSLSDATASVDCTPDELYSVTYASFGSADDLHGAFEAFASPADLTNIDCAHDASGRHPYTINGTAAGEVACYVEEGTSPGTTDSVIVWTDEELGVLGRAVRGDPADLTLYEWWRTESGPWRTEASPSKDGEPPATIEGVFQGSGRTLVFENDRYHESEFGDDYGDSLLLYGKPSTVLMLHQTPAPTFGGICPRYEMYRWQLRGDRLSLRLIEGGCREYSSAEITNVGWTRVG